MQYTELIKNLTGDSPPAFLATATTGLKPEDELIAVFSLALGAPEPETELMMRDIPADKLQPAQAYHGIGPQEIRSFGQTDDLVRERLDSLFDRHTVFSYNPQFQGDFLSRFGDRPYTVHDLPMLLQAADMRMAQLADAGLNNMSDLEQALGRLVDKAPGFKAICRRYGVSPREFLLPVQSACWQLYGLWEQLSLIPVQ